MEKLAGNLMRLFALALNLNEHWFDDKVDKHMTNFVVSNYPDQPHELPKGQLRAGAHTDYGSVTIIKADDKPGGLEVLDSKGQWRPVPIVPGTFIVDLGDLMAQIDQRSSVSTMRRVVNPRETGQRQPPAVLDLFSSIQLVCPHRMLPTCLTTVVRTMRPSRPAGTCS